MTHTPSRSGRLRRAAAGLAIVAVLPLTMAASCDTGEEQDEQERQEQEEDGQDEDD